MKLSEIYKALMESPYQHDGEMEREPFSLTFTSNSSLDRNYKLLGLIEVEDEMVGLYSLKGATKVIGTIKQNKPAPNNELSNRVVFSLKFKSKHTLTKIPSDLDQSKIIQVDKVSTDKSFEGFGIAS